jgi:glycosyltransferase involved in cell wall biosynthesis
MGINILYVVGGYGGGVKTYLDNLSQHLLKSEAVDSISILTFEQAGNLPLITNGKLEYSILPTKDFEKTIVRNLSPRTLVRANRSIKEIVTQKKIDLFHIHTHNIPLADIATFTSLTRNIPLVVTYHGSDKRSLKAHISINTFGLIPKYFADKKFAVSHAAQNILGKDSEIVGVPIHESFYSDQFEKGFFSRYGIHGEKIVFYPARIDPKKGQMDLVLAEYKLLNDGCRIPHKIVLAGDVQETAYLKLLQSKISEYGLGQNIILTERIPFEQMHNAYHGSLIQAFPTREEGLPQIIIEAGLCGVPTIGSTVGGVPELVHDGVNGYLITSGDVNSLEDRLVFLMNHDDVRKRLGDNARVDFLEKFNAAHVAQRHLDVYLGLIKKSVSLNLN